MTTAYMQSEDYLDYLIANCGVRGFDIEDRTEACTRPDVDIILRYCEWLGVRPGDRLLEVGCGVGRILKELHDAFEITPSGADPFAGAIEAATLRVGDLCRDLTVASVEKLPYPSQEFDQVLCWGVFDLTDQAKALTEMSRTLRVGGRLLLTGKNDRYQPNDLEALAAEEASRSKGIPNHYTDVHALLGLAQDSGLVVERARYFPRRGDFMADRYVVDRPDRFYEYVLCLRKDSHHELTAPGPIASLSSVTHREKLGER